ADHGVRGAGGRRCPARARRHARRGRESRGVPRVRRQQLRDRHRPVRGRRGRTDLTRGSESTILIPGDQTMDTVTTRDGVEIFYKDWGPKDARPIVFHHGWPLSSDDWDAQLLFFLGKGYRVVTHDRRGHGRSSQVGEG